VRKQDARRAEMPSEKGLKKFSDFLDNTLLALNETVVHRVD